MTSRVAVGGCTFTTRLVCVLRPSSTARTMGPLKRIGRSFIHHLEFIHAGQVLRRRSGWRPSHASLRSMPSRLLHDRPAEHSTLSESHSLAEACECAPTP